MPVVNVNSPIMTQEERTQWYRELAAAASSIRLIHPLVGSVTFAAEDFRGLQHAVFHLLAEACTPRFEGDLEAFLAASDQHRLSIDTTPGSVIKISYKTYAGYTRLHHQIGQILKHLRILERITAMSLANLRVVAGEAKTPDTEKRAYATSKTHIDVWAGEPNDIVHLWIPLAGDVERTTMDLFAPPERLFTEGWLRPLDNYEAAEGLVTDPPLDLNLSIGRALLFDGSCPHRTRRMQGATRISMDVKLLRKPFDATTQFASSYLAVEDIGVWFS